MVRRVNDVWAERSQASWRALRDNCIRGTSSLRVCEPRQRRRVALWPLSQFLWLVSVRSASLGIDRYTGLDQWWLATNWYRQGAGFVDHRPRGRRYFDDNAWVGLIAAQQWLLTGEPRWRDRAALLGRFLLNGITSDGGVAWVEGGDTVNACSTGSAGLLFAVLADSAGSVENNPWRAPAHNAATFLQERLLRSDGLIADHVRGDGSVEPSVWSYNQGLAVALFDRTGHSRWADDLVASVGSGLPAQVLHRQPAAFNVVWYRTLLARQPDQIPPDALNYLDQAWSSGRDQRGLLSGVDRYDDGVVIDHSALTGLMSAIASPPSVRRCLL
jgi:hypothetical protein